MFVDLVRKLVEDIDMLAPGGSRDWNPESFELGFLNVLCWGGWRETRAEMIINSLRLSYLKLGKRLDQLSDADIEVLQNELPYNWQKDWLHALVLYLRTNAFTFDEFCDRVRTLGSDQCRASLKAALAPYSQSDKIVECFMRDVLQVDAFPIDTRVREVLESRGIPPDSSAVRDCIRMMGLDPKEYARKVYRAADELTLKVEMESKQGVESE